MIFDWNCGDFVSGIDDFLWVELMMILEIWRFASGIV